MIKTIPTILNIKINNIYTLSRLLLIVVYHWIARFTRNYNIFLSLIKKKKKGLARGWAHKGTDENSKALRNWWQGKAWLIDAKKLGSGMGNLEIRGRVQTLPHLPKHSTCSFCQRNRKLLVICLPFFPCESDLYVWSLLDSFLLQYMINLSRSSI